MYGPAGSYNFFAGRDASRAYTTGNFTDDLTDDLSGLAAEELAGVVQWHKDLSAKYSTVGRGERSRSNRHRFKEQRVDFVLRKEE